MDSVALVLLLVGGLLAVQAAANVQLSVGLGSPLGASALQLAVGAFVLLVMAAATLSLGTLARLPDVPRWHLVGGIGSSLYITAGILLFPRLGAVVTVGLFIAGQILASLLLDDLGWLGIDAKSAGAAAIGGAAAVLLGAAALVSAAGSAVRGDDTPPGRRAAWVALALAAGGALPVQGAINAQLRADLDRPLAVATISFLVAAATMALALGAARRLATVPAPCLRAARHVPWWGWAGGFCGAAYVTAVFLFIPRIGAEPVIALTVAGQQLASLVVDRLGLLRMPRRPITRLRIAGVGLLLAGVLLVELA
jgi:transporter family-2 protein